MTAIASTPFTAEPFGTWLSDVHWAPRRLTFGFPADGGVYTYGQPGDYSALGPGQKQAVRRALDEIAGFTGLTLTESTGAQATLRFAREAGLTGAYAYEPAGIAEGGDSFYGAGTYRPVIGNEANLYFLHEIGHTLGLGHGHESPTFAASGLDGQDYTLMTYSDYVGDQNTYSYDSGAIDWAQSYMQLDIAALQFLYGANYAASGEAWSGDTVYGFDPDTGEMFVNGAGIGTPAGNRIFRTIWDGHGTDTYDLRNYASDLRIDLAPGAWSVFAVAQLADLNRHSPDPRFLAGGNVANARLVDGDPRALIENARGGSGDDVIKGNQGDNLLTGGRGADRLFGRDGNDVLCGNRGDDVLGGGAGADRLYGGPQDDTLRGGAGNDRLSGGDGADVLFGQTGRDSLFGGDGTDRLEGGDGDDTLTGGAGADLVTGGDGDDVAEGEDGNDRLEGGIGDDSLSGGDGPDRLFGDEGADRLAGGRHGDFLAGGAGGDRLDGGNGGDRLLGQYGADDIRGGYGHDWLDGGRGADALRGGPGDDTLRGGGGTDQLFGLAGADVFLFTRPGDSPTSAAPDMIRDFTPGEDRIDLASFDPASLDLDVLGRFSGAGASAVTRELAGDTRVLVDTDGDRSADFRVLVAGVTGLTEDDFLL